MTLIWPPRLHAGMNVSADCFPHIESTLHSTLLSPICELAYRPLWKQRVDVIFRHLIS